MIDPTFTTEQQQAMKDQLARWKNAGGANVTFNFVEPSQAGGGATTGGPETLSIMRQVPTNLGPTAQGETRAFRITEIVATALWTLTLVLQSRRLLLRLCHTR